MYNLNHCAPYFKIVFFIHDTSAWFSIFFLLDIDIILSHPSHMYLMQVKVLGSSIIILSVGIYFWFVALFKDNSALQMLCYLVLQLNPAYIRSEELC